MVTCAICKQPSDTVRIVVRDDYDQIRATYAAPLSGEDQERSCALMDRLVDPLRQAECRTCRIEFNVHAS